MNFYEKKNLLFRLIAAFVIFLNLGFDGFVLYYVIMHDANSKIVSIMTCIFAAVMMIFEIALAIKGWNKENSLYKIAFNPNGRLNNVPFVAVLVFSIFGLGLLILSTLLNVLKGVEPYLTISYVILVVAVYLVSNCLLYDLYCWMFKTREINLKNFIK